jgi:hypothetical protein
VPAWSSRPKVALSIGEQRQDELSMKAWEVAEEFGCAKTYDAEYVALAKLSNCRPVLVERHSAPLLSGRRSLR